MHRTNRRGLAVLFAACFATTTPRLPLLPDIAARPSLEQLTRHYTEMQGRIKQVIDAETGPRTWRESEPARSYPCGTETGDVRARKQAMPLFISTGGITQQQWRTIAPASLTIIREYGFSTDGVLAYDRPGNNELGAKDPYDAYFSMGSENNTTMSVETGCHYPQDVLATLR